MEEELKKMGFIFRNLILHSNGDWSAGSLLKKKGGLNIEEWGKTPLEAVQKLRQFLEDNGYLDEAE